MSTSTGVEVGDGAETRNPVVIGATATGGYSDLVTFEADGDGVLDLVWAGASELTVCLGDLWGAVRPS